MVVGQRVVDGTWWRHTGLSYLEDIRFGAPHAADITIYIGTIPAELASHYHEVTKRCRISTRLAEPDCSAEQWARDLADEALQSGIDVVLFLAAADEDLAAVERLTSSGIATAVTVTGRDLARLAQRSRKLEPGEMHASVAMLANARLILTASSWECDKTKGLVGGDGEVFAYLRGIDLTKASVHERGGDQAIRLLYVADDAGSVSLRRVIKAAQDLADERRVHFTILTSAPAEPAPNIHFAGPMSGEDRLQIYHRFDAIISPLEATGFSQPLMEALACGCAGLVPKPYFGSYSAGTPLGTYGVRDGDLAAAITGLADNRDMLRELQRNAPPFAQAYFDRMQWGEWLRGTLDWLGRGGPQAGEGGDHGRLRA